MKAKVYRADVLIYDLFGYRINIHFPIILDWYRDFNDAGGCRTDSINTSAPLEDRATK